MEIIPISKKEHTILGISETCMECHKGMKGFSPFHDPSIIGCTPCHSGNPYETEKEKSHEKMVLIPGNLSDINLTCGTLDCHGKISERINNSLMTTMSGVISKNRKVFGEDSNPDGYYHIKELSLESATDTHLRQLCASCHLGNEKKEVGPNSESSRGGGCNACHLTYNEESVSSMKAYQLNIATLDSNYMHPKLSIHVPDNQCFGCHSRSARISTSFEGWHETQLSKDMIQDSEIYRTLEDGRVFQFISPDIHHQKGMECIDCHSANEVMGDGKRYAHSKDAVRVQCIDCHRTENVESVSFDELDEESKTLLNLRNGTQPNDKYLIQENGGEAMYNVLASDEDSIWVINKNKGTRHLANKPGPDCNRGKAHNELTCQACHTPWVPQCVGCHNVYENETYAYDLLDHKKVQGKWREYLGEFRAELPALGVIETKTEAGTQQRKIKTFVSGMILSIDIGSFSSELGDSVLFHRLYSPIEAHTTSAKSRSCVSCHNDPKSLGYGHGSLTYKNAEWEFVPEYKNSEYDGLPEDAWIGFLTEHFNSSKNEDMSRSFTISEQKKILTVGACLTCHEGNSEIMKQSLMDFDKSVSSRGPNCIIPVWK